MLKQKQQTLRALEEERQNLKQYYRAQSTAPLSTPEAIIHATKQCWDHAVTTDQQAQHNLTGILSQLNDFILNGRVGLPDDLLEAYKIAESNANAANRIMVLSRTEYEQACSMAATIEALKKHQLSVLSEQDYRERLNQIDAQIAAISIEIKTLLLSTLDSLQKGKNALEHDQADFASMFTTVPSGCPPHLPVYSELIAILNTDIRECEAQINALSIPNHATDSRRP